VGSLTSKLVLIDGGGRVLYSRCLRNDGGPIEAVQALIREIPEPERKPVAAAGATGSGRQLAAAMVGADVVVNEITAHALAARTLVPEVRTVIDIGGQDSKIIYLRDGVTVGFNMNTVCAAGTGSFLDHQAGRLNLAIEEFGSYALRAKAPVAIAGRCGVFAESDLIHKQQLGYRKEDLIAGLCLALAKNYLGNVARNRKIEPPVLFQGGVAANAGMRWALEKLLQVKLQVPPYYQVMGALGAALLALERFKKGEIHATAFRGFQRVAKFRYQPRGFICGKCANNCEISALYVDRKPVARWGSRCGRWELTAGEKPEAGEEAPLL
jgi:predicted CoA-substrate-specific enzyme activase